MARKTFPAMYLCGGDFNNLDPRSECPNVLHDWPLPRGYVDASEVAGARIAAGWSNRRCPDCGLYGWAPGAKRGASTNPIQVQRSTPQRKEQR